MVMGSPERADEGWIEFDNLDFMNAEDDSEEKAAAERGKFGEYSACASVAIVHATQESAYVWIHTTFTCTI